MTNIFNEFAKPIEHIGRKHGISRVFNDLLIMGICSFHSVNIQSQLTEKDQGNEALYMETIEPYSKEELNEFAKVLGVLQLNILDKPYSDLLGEYFTMNITKGHNGQFFTPEPVCEMMARIILPSLKTEEGKRILDPACGSGRTLLSAAKINHKNYFFGADNDRTCAKMATLNFFLNGLKGEIAWMNSLTMEWYGGWHINMNGLGIIFIEKEQSFIWKHPPKIKLKSENQARITQQLSLF
ncbi:N-6 DNA methylase [Tenacibaculum agarivorans]|uniref:N-6 DNA methylase n=1 Tax=Tenacibaculum agarivorans TaxID=1908389 RepID=UPI00094BC521|nr:N-6 DNA methylase [Tenacibaculum agarivorans]